MSALEILLRVVLRCCPVEHFRNTVYIQQNTRRIRFHPPPPTQARKLKLQDFEVRVLCDEWSKLDRDATYLLPVQHLPLLWQTVSDKGQQASLRFLPTRRGPVSDFTRGSLFQHVHARSATRRIRFGGSEETDDSEDETEMLVQTPRFTLTSRTFALKLRDT